MGYYYGFKPYVRVAKRRVQAQKEVAKRLKNGEKIFPVKIEGTKIAKSFWGKAWCTNLESYGDYANRLPRGRTYARNGSVVHLAITKGRIDALVSGSDLYEIRIDISGLSKTDWQALKEQSAGKIGTMIELLQGKLSSAVMELVTDRDQGLFPKPKEIKMSCSCPDHAGMCKHIAAVMYGIGHRLDSSPELLFVLRGVDHLELIEQSIPAAPARANSQAATINSDDLGAIFDIEIGTEPAPRTPSEMNAKTSTPKATKQRSSAKLAVASKTANEAIADTARSKKVTKTRTTASKATAKSTKKAVSKTKMASKKQK